MVKKVIIGIYLLQEQKSCWYFWFLNLYAFH